MKENNIGMKNDVINHLTLKNAVFYPHIAALCYTTWAFNPRSAGARRRTRRAGGGGGYYETTSVSFSLRSKLSSPEVIKEKNKNFVKWVHIILPQLLPIRDTTKI